jgi:hypothetical protein
LYRFAEMRYDLLAHIGTDLARHIDGTTDTEWVYALVLSRLADPFGPAGAEKTAGAVCESLRISPTGARAARHRPVPGAGRPGTGRARRGPP